MRFSLLTLLFIVLAASTITGFLTKEFRHRIIVEQQRESFEILKEAHPALNFVQIQNDFFESNSVKKLMRSTNADLRIATSHHGNGSGLHTDGTIYMKGRFGFSFYDAKKYPAEKKQIKLTITSEYSGEHHHPHLVLISHLPDEFNEIAARTYADHLERHVDDKVKMKINYTVFDERF